MNSIVIYATRYGNTHKVAEAVAKELRSHGTAQLLAAEEAPSAFPSGTDLVVVGGPTEGHRMTEAVARFFGRLGPEALKGVAGAAFDTRLDWPMWLSGSAAAGISKRLRGAGARIVLPEASFLVARATNPAHREPLLASGELDRAAGWAASLAVRLEAALATGARMGS